MSVYTPRRVPRLTAVEDAPTEHPGQRLYVALHTGGLVETEIVRFPQETAVLDDLRDAGIDPNGFGRAAFEEAYRRFAVDRKIRFLEEAAQRHKKRMREEGLSRIDWAAVVRAGRRGR